MKNTWVSCLLGLLSLGSAALLQAQQTSGGTEKAIATLENQWLQAQQTNNPDLVAPLLADKFVSTGADGKVTNKIQALADANGRSPSTASHVEQTRVAKCRALGPAARARGART